jgi:hypothetical protein
MLDGLQCQHSVASFSPDWPTSRIGRSVRRSRTGSVFAPINVMATSFHENDDQAPSRGGEWDNWRRRVRSEFREMPGLILSVKQAQRLWHLDGAVVEQLFSELVDAGELRQTANGQFIRARQDR